MYPADIFVPFWFLQLQKMQKAKQEETAVQSWCFFLFFFPRQSFALFKRDRKFDHPWGRQWAGKVGEQVNGRGV